MKYTQTTLDKIEKVIEEAGYIVRYERGSFQSGFCILEDRKVVVLNKFLQLEGRINTLIDLIPQLRIEGETLTPESGKIFIDIMGKYNAAQEEKRNEDEERKARRNAEGEASRESDDPTSGTENSEGDGQQP
jgi:hypothetical protein